MISCSRPPSRSERRGLARLARAVRAWLFAGALLLPCARGATAQSGEGHVTYLLVASDGVPVSNVTLADATRMLLSERRFWSSGAPIVVLMPPVDSPARKFLLERMFHMTEQAYRRHTLEQLYRGELEYAPKVVASHEEALAFLAASHGALSIVPSSSTLPAGARALRINGRASDAPGYELVH